MKLKSIFLWSVLSVSALCLATGCQRNQPNVEQPPSPNQSTAQIPTVKTESVADPKLPEVEAAVKRVFKDAAVIPPEYKNRFLTGDFNGDLSQDLAVVLKPAPDKLAELNEEYPRWLLRDPRSAHNQRTPLRVEKDEPLLAVIHGYGANAWRDPAATQTFLLKNVVGADMRVQNGKDFVNTHSGQAAPRVHGDLIGEKLKGSAGFLYYNVANYSWYDPKTFKGDSATTAGVFHGRKAAQR